MSSLRKSQVERAEASGDLEDPLVNPGAIDGLETRLGVRVGEVVF